MDAMLVYRSTDDDPLEYLLETQPGDVVLYGARDGRYRAGVVERVHNGTRRQYLVLAPLVRRIAGKRWQLRRCVRASFDSVVWIRRPRQNRK